MATLLAANGQLIKDAAGELLKVACLVRADLFGEGKVTGTFPLDSGQGLNVLIEWAVSRCTCAGRPTAGSSLFGWARSRVLSPSRHRSCSKSSTFVSSGPTGSNGASQAYSCELTTTPMVRLR